MARPVLPPPGFDDLSPDEKLEYIQAPWDRVAEHPEDVPVPDWHRQVIAERLAAYARILANPFEFPSIELGVRRALVRDFPYGVFFTMGADLITVLAVLHLRHHPDSWKRRRRDLR